MSVRISKNSRLQFADLLVVDGFEFWNIVEFPSIVPQGDDIRYQIKDTDRIDLLAYTYYGDPILWWVIAVANDMEIIPTDFKVGDQITIPSPRYVRTQLFNQAR